MRYTLFHNVSARFMRPFADEDRVIEGYSGEVEEPDDDGTNAPYLATCEELYRRHNRDDRPDGQQAPSLSVGDVILLHREHNTARAYTVAPVGFEHTGFMAGHVYRGGYQSVYKQAYHDEGLL